MNSYDIRYEIRTLPDLMYAASRVKTIDERRAVINQAVYLGLSHKLPKDWRPDGLIEVTEEGSS